MVCYDEEKWETEVEPAIQILHEFFQNTAKPGGTTKRKLTTRIMDKFRGYN